MNTLNSEGSTQIILFQNFCEYSYIGLLPVCWCLKNPSPTYLELNDPDETNQTAVIHLFFGVNVYSKPADNFDENSHKVV